MIPLLSFCLSNQRDPGGKLSERGTSPHLLEAELCTTLKMDFVDPVEPACMIKIFLLSPVIWFLWKSKAAASKLQCTLVLDSDLKTFIWRMDKTATTN